MSILKGKTAIITGASRGIGKALAKTTAELGVNLAITARNARQLEEVANELKAASAVEVLPVVCDMTKLSDLENLVAKVEGEFGPIDILINNAGISSQYPFERQPLSDFETLAATNFLGYVRLIRLVINGMINNKSGAIINMISGSTLCDPVPKNFLVYSSLKVGLKAFTKGLFFEMRDHGIKVTSLVPGMTNTSLTDTLKGVSSDASRLMTTEAIEAALKFALLTPANVCPLEIAVVNQRTAWVTPTIAYAQQYPER